MNPKDLEIKRLRELVDAGKGDRNAIDELVDENLRLRELLDDVFHDWVFDGLDDEGKMELLDRTAKELGK